MVGVAHLISISGCHWPHMNVWLDYTERMSFLLSQRLHVCDIALIYPTEAIQAYPSMKPDSVRSGVEIEQWRTGFRLCRFPL